MCLLVASAQRVPRPCYVLMSTAVTSSSSVASTLIKCSATSQATYVSIQPQNAARWQLHSSSQSTGPFLLLALPVPTHPLSIILWRWKRRAIIPLEEVARQDQMERIFLVNI